MEGMTVSWHLRILEMIKLEKTHFSNGNGEGNGLYSICEVVHQESRNKLVIGVHRGRMRSVETTEPQSGCMEELCHQGDSQAVEQAVQADCAISVLRDFQDQVEQSSGRPALPS